jgi:hypothetical protein
VFAQTIANHVFHACVVEGAKMQRIPIQMGKAGPIFFGHRAKIWPFYFPQKPQIPQPFLQTCT